MITKTKNPFGKYNGNEAEYVIQALDSENPDNNRHPWPQRFEELFCQKLGVKYAIACNSGTSGLHAALYAAGVGPGDEVISPAMTVIMDAYAIIHLGAMPVFADIDRGTYTIDPEDIIRKITPRTRAILTVSLQGLSCDIDPIMEIANQHNLMVIDDSCQTLMGRYKGRMAGTMAHLNVFSFENKKHITTGSEGGMIVSDDENLAMRARKFAGIGYLHMTAAAGRTHLALSTAQDPDYLRFDTIGLNYRMNAVSAAIGVAQLERVDAIVGRRKQVAAMFHEAVQGCAWMIPQMVPEVYEHSYYTYAVEYRGDETHGLSWKGFYNLYQEKGGDGFYAPCMIPYLEPALKGSNVNGGRYEQGQCPVAESLQQRVMQFKTNYRNLDIANRKAEILGALIDKIGR